MQLLSVALTDAQFEEPRIYRHCQHAGTRDNPPKQRICWFIQINTTNKFDWQHNGMMTTTLLVNNTPEEWSQQCCQEQKHQNCVYNAAEGDDFKADRSH